MITTQAQSDIDGFKEMLEYYVRRGEVSSDAAVSLTDRLRNVVSSVLVDSSNYLQDQRPKLTKHVGDAGLNYYDKIVKQSKKEGK